MQIKQSCQPLALKPLEISPSDNSVNYQDSSKKDTQVSARFVDDYCSQSEGKSADNASQNICLEPSTHRKKDKNKKPSIYRAAEIGNTQKLVSSLKKGEDPNLSCPGQIYKWPLFAACVFGHVDCARILLEHGANPNVVDVIGMSPLTYALIGWEEKPEICKLLLEYGASTDARYSPNSTIAQRYRTREEEEEKEVSSYSSEKSKIIKDMINKYIFD